MATKCTFRYKNENEKRNLLHHRKEHVFFVGRRYHILDHKHTAIQSINFIIIVVLLNLF